MYTIPPLPPTHTPRDGEEILYEVSISLTPKSGKDITRKREKKKEREIEISYRPINKNANILTKHLQIKFTNI